MAISDARVFLEGYLGTLLGLTGFQAVQFSLLPEDSPLGYLQLLEANSVFNSRTIDATFLVAVGLSAESFDDLSEQVESMVYLIVNTLSSNFQECIQGVSKVALEGNVVIDTYDSYATSNHISDTTVWSGKIAFRVRVSIYKD